MAKTNPLEAHLASSRFRDDLPAFDASQGIVPRLALAKKFGVPGGWKKVARMVSDLDCSSPPLLLPDANVAILREAKPFWDSAEALFRKDGQAAVGIPSPVYSELEEWLRNPRGNKQLAASISEAVGSRGGWCSHLDIEDVANEEVRRGVDWYISLLMHRRDLALPKNSKGQTLLGVDAQRNNGGDAKNAVHDMLGVRSVTLAKKGRKDHERYEGVFPMNDEAQVMLAFAHAFSTGRETFIVTADSDVYEAFFKVQHLLGVHYRSMWAGRKIALGDWGKPFRMWEEHGGAFFNGPVRLYPRTQDLREVLPEFFASVGIGVIYVAPKGNVSVIFAHGERGVIEVLEAIGRTGGRVSEEFGTQNVHAAIWPAAQPEEVGGDFLAIGEDVCSHYSMIDGEVFNHSNIDHALAISEEERYGPVTFNS